MNPFQILRAEMTAHHELADVVQERRSKRLGGQVATRDFKQYFRRSGCRDGVPPQLTFRQPVGGDVALEGGGPNKENAAALVVAKATNIKPRKFLNIRTIKSLN